MRGAIFTRYLDTANQSTRGGLGTRAATRQVSGLGSRERRDEVPSPRRVAMQNENPEHVLEWHRIAYLSPFSPLRLRQMTLLLGRRGWALLSARPQWDSSGQRGTKVNKNMCICGGALSAAGVWVHLLGPPGIAPLQGSQMVKKP